MINDNRGSSFEEFLESEGLLDEAEATAVKRVIAFEIKAEMKRKKISKQKLADVMKTSRSSLDRLLDPKNASVTLKSLVKAAHALGKKLAVTLK